MDLFVRCDVLVLRVPVWEQHVEPFEANGVFCISNG